MTKLEKLIQDKGFERRDLSKIELQVLCELQDIIDMASMVESATGTDEDKMKSASAMIEKVEDNADKIFKLCYTYKGGPVDDAALDEHYIPTKQIATTILLEPIMEIFASSTEEVEEEAQGKRKRVTRRG